MTNPKHASWSLAVFFICFALARLAAGETFSINGPMIAGGNVRDWKFSPSGDYVVYLADERTDGVTELFSRQLVGGNVHRRLNQPLVGMQRVSEGFAISSKGKGVIFGVGESFRTTSVFTTTLDASISPALVNIDGPTTGGGVLSGDGEYVQFQRGPDLFTRSVEATGPEVQLNPPGTIALNVGATNTEGVKLFEARLTNYSSHLEGSLYAVPSDGSVPAWKVSQEVDTGGEYTFGLHFAVPPTGDHVVYKGNFDTSNRRQLYSRRIDGSTPFNVLNNPLQANENGVGEFSISPDGRQVAYNLDRRLLDSQLFTVPVDRSSPPIQLGAKASNLTFTPDSSRVVFRAGDASELYAADGNAPAVPLHPPGNGRIRNFLVTDDSQYVVFTKSHSAGPQDFASLFVAALDGSLPPTQISPPLKPGESITEFVYSNELKSIVYGYSPATTVINQETVSVAKQLYSIPLLGGTPKLLSDPLSIGTHIAGLELSPSGKTIVFGVYKGFGSPVALRGIHLVPEPSSIVMVLFGLLTALGSRCRREWEPHRAPLACRQ